MGSLSNKEKPQEKLHDIDWDRSKLTKFNVIKISHSSKLQSLCLAQFGYSLVWTFFVLMLLGQLICPFRPNTYNNPYKYHQYFYEIKMKNICKIEKDVSTFKKLTVLFSPTCFKCLCNSGN